MHRSRGAVQIPPLNELSNSKCLHDLVFATIGATRACPSIVYWSQENMSPVYHRHLNYGSLNFIRNAQKWSIQRKPSYSNKAESKNTQEGHGLRMRGKLFCCVVTVFDTEPQYHYLQRTIYTFCEFVMTSNVCLAVECTLFILGRRRQQWCVSNMPSEQLPIFFAQREQ